MTKTLNYECLSAGLDNSPHVNVDNSPHLHVDCCPHVNVDNSQRNVQSLNVVLDI